MSKTLKDFGFIAYCFERFFRFLQFLPPWVILSNRPDIQKKFTDVDDLQKKTKRRALFIDLYMLFFIIIEIVFTILVSKHSLSHNWLGYVILIFAIIRIVDILQVNINMVLFDHLRLRKNEHYMASAVRTIINNLINYFELILCFGLIYTFNSSMMKDSTQWLDAFYLSISSQINISLADITPIYWNRLLVAIQGFIGFFFGLLIFARVISILPHIKSVLETDN